MTSSTHYVPSMKQGYLMTDHHIFDVDGTLTPSRAMMDPAFLSWFTTFNSTHNVYLVTGSDSDKTIEQIGTKLFNSVQRSYNCSGNDVYENGTNVFSTGDLELPLEVCVWCQKKLATSPFSYKTGGHFEARSGLYNFSIVGRHATTVERALYVIYDKYNNERVQISDEFNSLFSSKYNIVSQVAGETGLDIIPIGKDKSQILKDFNKSDNIMFYGDSIYPGGNDWSIAKAIEEGYASCTINHVKNWKETWNSLLLL